MPSRKRDLVRPRSIALLLAGLVGGHLASRLRVPGSAETGEARRPPPGLHRFSGPVVGFAILLSCGILVGAYLGWTAVRAQAQTRAVAIALTGGQPDKAPALFARYGCRGCHAIPGAPGADGKVAAPLTAMRARVYVAGVLPNTADNLIAWIVDPPAFSPRTAMPVTGITEAEARDVAAYLYSH